MPKSLVVGNGNLLVNFDQNLLMRDFYYPYVGLEEHTTFGNFHRLGFYVDGKFSWLGDWPWKINFGYQKDTLIGEGVLINEDLKLEIKIEDFVYTSHNIFFRQLTILNKAHRNREIRVYFSHNFYIYGVKLQDTAEYEPRYNAVLHYRRNRYFLLNGIWENGGGLDQYAIGKSGFKNLEGTYRDAEDDGELQGNPVEQGSVDSTIRFSQNLDPGESQKLHFWICAGRKYHEVCFLNKRVNKLSPIKIYRHTRDFWKEWVNKQDQVIQNLPTEVGELYKRSLLVVRTQVDNRGGIMAACDTDILQFNRDSYSYMWPRDGAFISMALSRAGYEEICRRFFIFCQKALTAEGYMLNKYLPDGSVGSSWHPKINGQERQLPIQEDETALVLIALEKYYRCFKNLDFVKSLFNELILKIGRWLISYRDSKSGLPLPSYDLWEEKRAIHSFTCATVYAALKSATYLSHITGHYQSASLFSEKAREIREAILTYLYSEKHGRFLKNIQLKDGKLVEQDPTVDASLVFIWKMGVLPYTDIRFADTMRAIQKELLVPGNIGGFARYQKDCYHFDFSHGLTLEKYHGNPWIITTLWVADYLIQKAQNIADLEEAMEWIKWVVKRANQAGILPEQVHPISGEPLSVAPLTWSHATFVSTVLQYKEKMRKLGG